MVDTNQILRVISPSDADIIKLAKFSLDNGIADTIRFTSVGTESVSITSLSEIESENFFDRCGRNSKFLSQVLFRSGNVNLINFKRSISVHRIHGGSTQLKEEPSAFEAEFQIWPMPNLDDELSKKLWKEIEKFQNIRTEHLIQSSEKFTAVLAKHVSDLAKQSSDISADLTRNRTKLERDYEARRKKLDADHDKRSNSLQDDYQQRRKDLEEEIAQKRAKNDEDLNRRSVELDKREELMDMRRAREARRDLRQKITNKIQTRLDKRAKFSSLLSINSAVITVVSVGIIFFATMALYSAGNVSNILTQENVSSYVLIYSAIKTTTLTILTTLLLFYLISYLRRLAQRVDNNRERLEYFSLDLDRASWVIETLMEMREEKDGVESVPEHWVVGATRGLFEHNISDAEPDTAIDAFAELMRKGPEVEIGPEGAKLKLAPSAAKKVGKSHS